MKVHPAKWEDTADRSRPGYLDFGNEVGRWDFVGRSQGWKSSRNHNFHRLEEGRKTGFECRSYVG